MIEAIFYILFGAVVWEYLKGPGVVGALAGVVVYHEVLHSMF